MPITIVLGNAEYCLMLVSLAAAIAVKSRKPAPAVCNVACQARIESLEQAVQSLQEMPRFNQSGCMLEPQERASNPQPLISSTPTLLPWIHAGTARLTPFRPTPATDPHNEKSTDLAKRLEASLSTLKKEAVSYGTHTDSVTLHMPYEKQGHCAFFTKLPLELRKLIYEHLLVSDETITPDRQLVGDKRENYLERNGDDYTPAKGLDATILQSCEAVYDEAYPILYGQNNFHFHDSLELYDFKADGMKPIYGMVFFSIPCAGTRVLFYWQTPRKTPFSSCASWGPSTIYLNSLTCYRYGNGLSLVTRPIAISSTRYSRAQST